MSIFGLELSQELVIILAIVIALIILSALFFLIKANKSSAKSDKNSKTKVKTKESKPKTKKEDSKNESGRYNGKFEIFPEGDYFRYRLKASNGEILVVSEMYASQETAKSAIDAVIRNTETGTFTIFDDKKGMHKFRLTSGNNRILVVSANYTTSAGANKAMESFKRFANSADTIVLKEPLKSERGSNLEPITVKKIKLEVDGKFEILKEKSGLFSWSLKANNGEILAQGDDYVSKDGCNNAINTFKTAIKEGQFFVSKDKKGLFKYRLYSKSGRLVVTGESYSTKALAESAANSVKSFYQDAVLVEVK